MCLKCAVYHNMKCRGWKYDEYIWTDGEVKDMRLELRV